MEMGGDTVVAFNLQYTEAQSFRLCVSLVARKSVAVLSQLDGQVH